MVTRATFINISRSIFHTSGLRVDSRSVLPDVEHFTSKLGARRKVVDLKRPVSFVELRHCTRLDDMPA